MIDFNIFRIIFIKEIKYIFKKKLNLIFLPILTTSFSLIMFYFIFKKKKIDNILFFNYIYPSYLMLNILLNIFTNTVLIINNAINSYEYNILECLISVIIINIIRGFSLSIILIILIYFLFDIFINNFFFYIFYNIIGIIIFTLIGILFFFNLNKNLILFFQSIIISNIGSYSDVLYTIDILPLIFQKIIKLNPIYYLLIGSRCAFLNLDINFFNNCMILISFIIILTLILIFNIFNKLKL